MGLFSRKDWNVIAIIFERKGLFQVNGNRGKGAAAEKIRDGAKRHDRTVFWATFDQKRAFLEGEPGLGARLVDADALGKLMRDLLKFDVVRHVLTKLEDGEAEKLAKPLSWPAKTA